MAPKMAAPGVKIPKFENIVEFGIHLYVILVVEFISGVKK